MTTGKYIFMLVWPGIVAIFAHVTNGKRKERILGRIEYRYNYLWAVVLAIPLIVIAAQRGYFADTSAYIAGFKAMPTTTDKISEYMLTVTKDELFSYVSILIKIFITQNYTVYLGIFAAFQMFALVKTYRKYSPDLFLSMFLFIASTDYISWMCNGLRQFIAACIIFLSAKLIFTKKYVFAILVILFASFFHGSALLVIPFIFIVQGKAWNKKTLLFIFAVIIAVSFVDQFTDILDSALSDTQYKNVVSDWTNSTDDGTNILRVLVYSVPAIISLFGRRVIEEHNDPVINICTNMSIASAGIYFVSMFTSGIFIGRLPIYFSLFSYILLPWEIDKLFNNYSKKIIKICLIVCYIIFYCIQVFNILG